MRHRSLLVPASLILLGVAGACDRTPDYVLKSRWSISLPTYT